MTQYWFFIAFQIDKIAKLFINNQQNVSLKQAMAIRALLEWIGMQKYIFRQKFIFF
jgi:hypothetical protein